MADEASFEQHAVEIVATGRPKCLGYTGGCDGDLEGQPHEPECPCFGKPEPPSWYTVAVRECARRLEAEALLKRYSERHYPRFDSNSCGDTSNDYGYCKPCKTCEDTAVFLNPERAK
jgi:hypothetical protein